MYIVCVVQFVTNLSRETCWMFSNYNFYLIETWTRINFIRILIERYEFIKFRRKIFKNHRGINDLMYELSACNFSEMNVCVYRSKIFKYYLKEKGWKCQWTDGSKELAWFQFAIWIGILVWIKIKIKTLEHEKRKNCF